jgi:hypothetical protein
MTTSTMTHEKTHEFYCTTYCNKAHRVRDGKPVKHECSILPPAALRAEINGDYEQACAILVEASPLPTMRRGVKA